MSESRKIGPFLVGPHLRGGIATGKWFVNIPASITGTGCCQRKLYDSQSVALAVAGELRRRLDQVSEVLTSSVPSSGLTFREAVERWQENEELRVATLKKKASTLEIELYRLRSLIAFFGPDDIASISEKRLMEYQRCRLQLGRKPRTINKEIAILSLVLRWAMKQGFISEVPKTEPIPTRSTTPVIPTPDEVVRIITALPSRLRPIVRFIAETGCRKGEAINLIWDCVDCASGCVEIRARERWTPKTQQSERRIPIGPGLVDLLRFLPREGPYVFQGRTPGTPIGNFRKAFAAAVRQAGIVRGGKPVRITPHGLRKAHATWQAMNGVPPSVLQDLLGHARGSKVTDQYYVFATEEAKRAAVIELPLGGT